MLIRSLFCALLTLASGSLVGCGEAEKGGSAPAAAAPAAAAPAAAAAPDTTGGLVGKVLYKDNCVLCHGINGDKCLYGARNLQQSTLSLEARMALIHKGRGKMPAFAPRLTDAQIEAVARYSRTLFKHAPADSATAGG